MEKWIVSEEIIKLFCKSGNVKKVICLDVKQLICDMQKEYNYYLRNGSRRPCHVGEVVDAGLYGVADTDVEGHFRERS